jgi:predicted nucleotidyltransferase
MNEKKKVNQEIMLNASMGDMVGIAECEQINEVEADDINLKSFEVQDELNPKFWINNKINSRVRLKLLDLADEFYDSLNIKWVKPKDIVLKGSIANYNWSKYSDVDVHILVDFDKVWKKKEFVQDYFDSKKALWSQEHDGLKIYGFPVEMYVEDANEDNPNSGIYSLNKNKWIVEPNDFQDSSLNENYIKRVSARIMTKIDEVEDTLKNEDDNHKLEVISGKVKKLFDKLHKQRQESLSKHGEMGTYNIIWKVLRRTKYLDKMWEIINTIYNKVNSIK